MAASLFVLAVWVVFNALHEFAWRPESNMNADIFLAMLAYHLLNKYGSQLFAVFGGILCVRAFWHCAQVYADVGRWDYAAVNNLLFALMPLTIIATRKTRMEIGH